jgi:hypothetical protein
MPNLIKGDWNAPCSCCIGLGIVALSANGHLFFHKPEKSG